MSNQHTSTNAIENDDWIPDEDEIAAHEAMEKAYDEAIDRVMGTDDKLVAAHTEIKRLTALIGVLTVTRNGFMNGKNEIVQLLKAEQRKTERLRKQIERLDAENESLRERIAIMEST